MSFNAVIEICDFCKNDFNCNNKDVEDLWEKYKSNFVEKCSVLSASLTSLVLS